MGEPPEGVPEARLARFVRPVLGQDAVLDDSLDSARGSVLFRNDEIAHARAHDGDHGSGLGGASTEEGGMRIDVARGDGDVSVEPEPRGPLRGERPGALTRGEEFVSKFVENAREAGFERIEEIGGGVAPCFFAIVALEACDGRSAHLRAHERRNDPILLLDDARGSVVHLPILAEGLQGFRQHPFG